MNEFLGGFVVGGLVGMILLATIPGSIVRTAHDALAQCELKLPRNQNCEIVAVPKELRK